jgi:flagellar operon protein
MADDVFIPNVGQIRGLTQREVPKAPAKGEGAGFAAELEKALAQSNVKLSGHAQRRVNSREIAVSPDQVRKLQTAIDKAGQKGSRESLVLIQDVAFVVSVRNRTIITAVDKEAVKENVFTNIDSAVIME